MKQETIYRYLGANGIIQTPVYLEGIYSTQMIQLTADDGKVLKNGDTIATVVRIEEKDVNKWIEIDA